MSLPPPSVVAPVPTPSATDLGGWFHTLDPFLFRISGDFGVRWYGISYLAGFVLAYLLLRVLIRRGYVSIPLDRAADAIMILVLGVVLGGRLGYIALYKPALLWTFNESPPWWGVLAINEGGMASHGAILGLILACVYLSRGFRDETGARVGATPPRRLMDMIALVGAPGIVFGRLANFVNGELLGKIVAMPGEQAPWWAVRYPQEILTGHAPELTIDQTVRLETMLVERAREGEDWKQVYGSILEAVQRGAPDLQARLEPLISARHPTQLYQAVAEGVLTTLAVWVVARKPRRAGVAGCWFLLVYGVGRIATEFVRLPDDHLKSAVILGLTRGQWLSALMVGAGVLVLLWIRSKKEAPLPGWGAAQPASDPSEESSG